MSADKENQVVQTKAPKPCPVSRSEFFAEAVPIEVTIHGQKFYAQPKQFSTGSFGWFLNGKQSIQFGDVVVPVQIGMNLTCVGSKDAAP